MGTTTRRVPALVGALASLALAGCWPQPGHDAGHSRFNPLEDAITPATVASLAPVWSWDTPEWIVSEPVVLDGTAYVSTLGSASAHAVAFDTGTGVPRWEQPIAGPPNPPFVATPAAVASGRIWVAAAGPGGSRQFRLDPRTGVPDGDDPDLRAWSPAIESGDHIVQNVGDASISVRDRATLAPVWSALFSPDETPLNFVRALPTVVGEHLVVDGPTTGRVFGFRLAGCGSPSCTPRWRTSLGGLQSSPAAGPGDRAFVLAGGDLVALDAGTGTVRWRAAANVVGRGALAVAGDRVYVAATGWVQAFDLDGTRRWGAPVAVDVAAPTVAGGVVHVGGSDGVVRAFAADGCGGATTCPELGHVQVAGRVRQLSVAEGRLFVVSEPTATTVGRITAFAPSP